MSGWTPEQLAGLSREEERKQLMHDAGVDSGDPAAREAWEAEHYEYDSCVYCGKDITLNTAAPDDSDLSLWRDDWDDADCANSPDGEHHAPDDPPDYSVTYGDEAKRDPCAECGIRSTDGVNMAGDRLCADDLAAIEDRGEEDVDWDDDAPQSAMLRYRDPERWAALHPGQD